jgi:probable HAF family extracellular repeat protein
MKSRSRMRAWRAISLRQSNDIEVLRLAAGRATQGDAEATPQPVAADSASARCIVGYDEYNGGGYILNEGTYTLIDGTGNARPYAINNAGKVTGTLKSNDSSQLMLYANGTLKGLGKLPDSHSATGPSINASDQIVGYAESDRGGDRVNRAFVHTGGRMYHLNTVTINRRDFVFDVATAINDAGQIVGHRYARGRPDRWRAFLLDPISPPTFHRPSPFST